MTKSSPASYRDIDDDGYTDVSGGIPYYISDGKGGTPVPAARRRFGPRSPRRPVRSSRGPAISTPPLRATARSRQQHRRPGRRERQVAVVQRPAGQRQFAGRGRRRCAGHEAGAVRRHLLRLEISSRSATCSAQCRRRRAPRTPTGRPGRQRRPRRGEPGGGLLDNAFGNQSLSIFSTGNGAPGFGTTAPPSPRPACRSAPPRSSAAPAGTRSSDYSQVVDNDVDRVVEPRAGRQRHERASTSWPTAPTRPATRPSTRSATAPSRGPRGAAPAARRRSRRAPRRSSTRHGARPAGRRRTPSRSARRSCRAPRTSTTSRSSRAPARSTPAARSTSPRACRAGVTPETWRPGGYAGQQWAAFPHVVAPGGSSEQQFSVEGGGRIKVSDRYLVRTDRVDRTFTSSPSGERERVHVQRAGLPDRRLAARQAAPERRAHGRPHGLRPLAVRRERRLHRRPGVADADVQLDGPGRRRPALARPRRRRRRRPRPAGDELEHRRQPRHRLREVGDRQGRVRPLHVPRAGQQRPGRLRPRPEGAMADGMFIGLQHQLRGGEPAADRLQAPRSTSTTRSTGRG